MRGVTLARTDSTPVVTDLSGTRMDPLDRAPLRQRIISIVLSAPSQGSSRSAPPPTTRLAAPSCPSSPRLLFPCGTRPPFGTRPFSFPAHETCTSDQPLTLHTHSEHTRKTMAPHCPIRFPRGRSRVRGKGEALSSKPRRSFPFSLPVLHPLTAWQCNPLHACMHFCSDCFGCCMAHFPLASWWHTCCANLQQELASISPLRRPPFLFCNTGMCNQCNMLCSTLCKMACIV